MNLTPRVFPLLTDEEAKNGCGIGLGSVCCKFLLAGPNGLECGRGSELHNTLVARKDFTAQRMPTAPYPDCQISLDTLLATEKSGTRLN